VTVPASRETLIALRAKRAAHRLATEIASDRIDKLGTVRCARCGRHIAVASDAAHPATDYEGRVVCRICIRARRVADLLSAEAHAAMTELSVDELREWVRQGLVELPFEHDPRPTLFEWLRARFRRKTRRTR
jgi:hypothetical protein